MIDWLKEKFNGVATWFKRLTLKVKDIKQDEYTVVCNNGCYYPKKNGRFAVEYPCDKVGFEVNPTDGIIGFPSNAQAMEFINRLKEL